MKDVTRILFNEYHLNKLGIDFMGYTLKKCDASYHHLIVPKRLGGNWSEANGAVLNRSTSHPYLHLIEAKDEEIFLLITSEIIDQKAKGRIDIENLRNIHDLLLYFEAEHKNEKGHKGKSLIKYQYKNNRIDL